MFILLKLGKILDNKELLIFISIGIIFKLQLIVFVYLVYKENTNCIVVRLKKFINLCNYFN